MRLSVRIGPLRSPLTGHSVRHREHRVDTIAAASTAAAPTATASTALAATAATVTAIVAAACR
jgi:hypothetical protein